MFSLSFVAGFIIASALIIYGLLRRPDKIPKPSQKVMRLKQENIFYTFLPPAPLRYQWIFVR